MRRLLGILTVAAFVAITLTQPVFAESTPEAKAWIDKMGKIYDKGPFSVDYSADLTTFRMGQTSNQKMGGTVTYGDQRHINMDFNMRMNLAQGATMDATVKTIADGETMWVEAETPMGKQVMKIDLDQMEELSDESPAIGGFGSSANMDPMSQIGAMARTRDFSLVGVADGRVTLSAKLSEEELGGLAAATSDAETVDNLILVLDEKTAVPLEVIIGGDEPIMRMEFINLTFHEAGSLPDDLFTYAPPEGVKVMDMGHMLQMRQERGGGFGR